MNATTTINPQLARKRIDAINDRLARQPDHPQKDKMLKNRGVYEKALAELGKDIKPPDRVLSRFDTLVAATRKIDVALKENPNHPNKAKMLERRAEYVTSLNNIKDFGREKPTKKPIGVKLEVPADILTSSEG